MFLLSRPSCLALSHSLALLLVTSPSFQVSRPQFLQVRRASSALHHSRTSVWYFRVSELSVLFVLPWGWRPTGTASGEGRRFSLVFEARIAEQMPSFRYFTLIDFICNKSNTTLITKAPAFSTSERIAREFTPIRKNNTLNSRNWAMP